MASTIIITTVIVAVLIKAAPIEGFIIGWLLRGRRDRRRRNTWR
jgi:hypothetical protein